MSIVLGSRCYLPVWFLPQEQEPESVKLDEPPGKEARAFDFGNREVPSGMFPCEHKQGVQMWPQGLLVGPCHRLDLALP